MGLAAKRLKKARRIRVLIASEFRALKNDDLRIEDALRNPSDALGRVRIYDVLRRAPGMGDEGASKLLRRAKVWPLTRLAAVTPEERETVISALPERARR